MNCENCKRKHDGKYGSSRFCTKECARGFSTKARRQEINEKVSKKLKENVPWNKGIKMGYYPRSAAAIQAQKETNRKKWLGTIVEWKNGDVKGNSKKGALRPWLRRYIFEKFENKCSECDWAKVNEYTSLIPLQVDHIDGNWDNSVESNLRLICPNCHSLTKTYGPLNKGNGRPDYRKERRNAPEVLLATRMASTHE